MDRVDRPADGHAEASPAGGPALTVVIPAYNEEEAIGDTVSRCLAARERIVAEAGLASVEVVVVSDGSTDRTEEIARSFEDVTVVAFETNRGYGAALKEGFRTGRGELVGFLDADGTCDPIHFVALCRRLEEEEADIALGSRLGPDSRMPAVRRIGNRLYALLLGLLANRSVTDAASGMRVMRRRALESLGPLPDGLDYTPAMSARALLKGQRVIEVPMPYEERVGESKLNVWRDGVGFLRSIVDGVLYHRPQRLFMAAAVASIAIAAALSLHPIEFYVGNRQIEEWMIYRFVVAFLLGSGGFLCYCAAALSCRMLDLAVPDRSQVTFWESLSVRLFGGNGVIVLALLLIAGSLLLVWPAAMQYLTTRQVTMHWSRVIVSAFGLLLALETLVTRTLFHIMGLWLDRPEGGRSSG